MIEEGPTIPHSKLASFEEAGLIHEIYLHGSYDFSKGYKRNFGCHAAELMFVVRNDEIAVSWHFNTEWYLKEIRDRFEYIKADGSGDLGIHYLHETEGGYESQCNYFKSGKCFCVCSYSEAREIFDAVIGAPEELWPRLRRVHQIGQERQRQEISDRARF